LQAILEAPDDDAPRLIYADWLEENGDPERAEFIRVQVALARIDEDAPRAELEERERVLLEKHRDDWLQRLPAWAHKQAVFRRGFVAEVHASVAQLKRGARSLFRAAPLEGLCILKANERLAELVALPVLARFRDIDLNRNKLTDKALQTLLGSGHLGQPRSLNLDFNNLTTRSAEALEATPALHRLERLDLYANKIGPAGLGALASSPHLGQLTSLGVGSTGASVEGVRFLAESPCLRRLAELKLTANNLGDEGIAALVSAQLPDLVRLELGSNEISSVGMGVLAAWPCLAGLRDLGLFGNHFGPEGLRRLLTAPFYRLRALDIGNCRLGVEGAAMLSASPRLAGLTQLAMGFSSLGDEGIRLLASSPYLTRLTHLQLYSEDIGPEGARALADSPLLAQLTYLNLSSNERLGDEGVKALAASGRTSNLTELILPGTGLVAGGFAALANCPHLQRLRKLQLGGCRVRPEEARLLIASPYLRQVTDLWVDGKLLDTATKDALRQRFGPKSVY
jgi:uncharacterized protein (TIGR02996 family)